MAIKKLLKGLVVSVATIIMFTVPVLASTGYFTFDVEIADDTDSVAYSSNTMKTNNYNRAYIEYNSSNIYSSDDFWFRVVGQYGDYTNYTESVKATARTGVYEPKYIETFYTGNNYRLSGQTYAYYVHVSGEWEP